MIPGILNTENTLLVVFFCSGPNYPLLEIACMLLAHFINNNTLQVPNIHTPTPSPSNVRGVRGGDKKTEGVGLSGLVLTIEWVVMRTENILVNFYFCT